MKLRSVDLLGSTVGYFVAWPLVASAFRMEFLTNKEIKPPGLSHNDGSEGPMPSFRERLEGRYTFIAHTVSKAFTPLKLPLNKIFSLPSKLRQTCEAPNCPGNLYLSSLADRYPIDMSAIIQSAPGHRPIPRFTKFSRVIHTREGKSTLSDQVIKWFNTRLGILDDVCVKELNIGSDDLFNRAYRPPLVEGVGDSTVGTKELRQAYLGFVDDFTTSSCIAPLTELRSSSNIEYCLRYAHRSQ